MISNLNKKTSGKKKREIFIFQHTIILYPLSFNWFHWINLMHHNCLLVEKSCLYPIVSIEFYPWLNSWSVLKLKKKESRITDKFNIKLKIHDSISNRFLYKLIISDGYKGLNFIKKKTFREFLLTSHHNIYHSTLSPLTICKQKHRCINIDSRLFWGLLNYVAKY